MGSAAARHAAGGGSIELRLVELGHPGVRSSGRACLYSTQVLGVNPLFDDHLAHASAHTESLWLTRWAREV